MNCVISNNRRRVFIAFENCTEMEWQTHEMHVDGAGRLILMPDFDARHTLTPGA
jgi:hypothetical protein